MVVDNEEEVEGRLTQGTHGAVAEETEHNCQCVEGHTVGSAGSEPKGGQEEKGEEEEQQQQGIRAGCAHVGKALSLWMPRGWMSQLRHKKSPPPRQGRRDG